MEKTNVLRLLDNAGISYRALEYSGEDGKIDALSIAEKTGIPPEQCFKTLVTENPAHDHFVFVMPATSGLDLKKAAKVSGSKSIAMILQKTLLPLTGYVHGGCSPIGMKKQFPTFIEETAQLYDFIGVSGGRIIDSYIDSKTFNVLEVRNSYVYDIWDNDASDGYCRVYNSYVTSHFGAVAYSNCIVAKVQDDSIADEKTVFNRTMSFDADFRPMSADALGVDAGDWQYYVYPEAFAHEAGSDVSGGQRVYNGQIDIGPGEYDYRGIFAKKLSRRSVAVEKASPAVVAADGAGLSLGSGDSLTLALFFRADGECSFKVDGSERVTVTADGIVLSPVGGVYSFSGNADDVRTVTIVSNGGDALVRDFLVSGPGLVVRVR